MKRIALVLLLWGTIANSIIAQPVLSDSTQLDMYFDGLITNYLQKNHIAGATAGIIKDEEILLLKGYGSSDVSINKAVRPDSTIFNIGSISKTFIWTAVMQLVEEGKLDLDQDINHYLQGISIPNTYDKPITLWHLMTHTPGFEEYFMGLFARDSTKLKPLKEILSNTLPARVRPPGTLASYSNRGAGLAALIVEQVTGLPFEEYVKHKILTPLEMNMTTFVQPLPDSLRPYMSRAYTFQGGFQERPLQFIPMGPVAAGSSTASDMMHFIQAHLKLGQYNGKTILDSTSARLMQQPIFSHSKNINAMGLGFYEMSRNGVTIYGHRGDTYWFHSILALFPKQNMGFFLSLNTQQGASVSMQILGDFVDHYFPNESLLQTISLGNDYLQQFTGNYRNIRQPYQRFTKALALTESMQVEATTNGKLKTVYGGKTKYWLPIDSLTFRRAGNSENIAFSKNENGKITYLFRDDMPMNALAKVPFVASQSLHYPLFIIAIIAMGITIAYWPVVYLLRRKYKWTEEATLPLPVKLVSWVNAALILAFYLVIGLWLIGPEAIVYGVPTSIKSIFILPLLSVIATSLMVYYTFRIWLNTMGGIINRLCFTLLTILFIAHLWQLYYWNILGFNF